MAKTKPNATWQAAEREAHAEGRWFSTHCHAPKGSTMWRPHGGRR